MRQSDNPQSSISDDPPTIADLEVRVLELFDETTALLSAMSDLAESWGLDRKTSSCIRVNSNNKAGGDVQNVASAALQALCDADNTGENPVETC